jgi:hypothetical protein
MKCINGSEDTRVLSVEKIGEKTQYYFNRQLLAKFIIFEHKVTGGSEFISLHPSCIEIIAYASYGTNSDSKIEATRLYLCSKKIFKLATLVEGQNGRRGSRPEGSMYAQIMMINYIVARILISKNGIKTSTKDDSLIIEWSPVAHDTDTNVYYDGFKILSQLPHIDHITDEIRDAPFVDTSLDWNEQISALQRAVQLAEQCSDSTSKAFAGFRSVVVEKCYRKDYNDVSKPHLDMSNPHLDISKPHLDISKPHLSISKPHLDMSKPHLDISKPHLGISKHHLLWAHAIRRVLFRIRVLKMKERLIRDKLILERYVHSIPTCIYICIYICICLYIYVY